MNEIVVFSTVDSMDSAHRIANELVMERLAACVNIVPGIRSVYRWNGKICDEGELLLIIKTVAANFEALRQRIKASHTYEVPEILAIPLAAGDADYLRWLSEQCR